MPLVSDWTLSAGGRDRFLCGVPVLLRDRLFAEAPFAVVPGRVLPVGLVLGELRRGVPRAALCYQHLQFAGGFRFGGRVVAPAGRDRGLCVGAGEFRGRGALLMMILAVSMFPQVAVLSGMFELVRWLGLYNNLLSLTLSYMIFTIPFTVWVLTTFMRGLPKELEEAAVMDGAKPWTIITRVFMPLLWPALVTTGLLAFIAAWNEFLFALTFTLTNTRRTVPVAIALITGARQHELPWGNIMAASVIVTVPVVLMVLFFQRRIVSGLTAGAVKG